MHQFVIGMVLLGLATGTANAQQQSSPEEPPAERIVVLGDPTGDLGVRWLEPDTALGSAADTARLLERAPGARVNDNGPLSAQVQYRGMFGPRMNVRIDGVHIHPGGPNWMDPPLHYLPPAQLESLRLIRGIASVSTGAQGIGGTVIARSKRGDFAAGDSLEFHGDVSLAGRSVNDSYSVGGLLSLASGPHRLEVRGSTEAGGDRSFGGGKLEASEHERHSYGVGYGLRLSGQELTLSFQHSDAGPTGNPSLPMDIRFLDTEILKAEYHGSWAGVPVQARLSYTDVDHGMNNFGLRPAGVARREVEATGRGLGFDLRASTAVLGGELAFGIDGHRARNEMDIFDADARMFFVRQLDDVHTDRTGVFAEWKGPLPWKLLLEAGVRYDRVKMDADSVDALPAQMLAPPGRLRDRFNAAQRDRADDDVDWVVKLRLKPLEHLSVELGAARKARSPSHLERYLWLPLEVTAGLADGNNYVGDIGLEPEVSHQLEFALTWKSDRFFFSPRGFYRRVDDYIQGTTTADPDVVAVSTLNGDPSPLRFTNVDAEFYGVDAEWGLKLVPGWRLDGLLSWVRGRRRDVHDNLYRISPLSATFALSYQGESWSATVDGAVTARQAHISREIVLNEVSTTNSKASAYALLNLQASWKPAGSALGGTHWKVGVQNLLDESYRDSLAGFNRVSGSDLGVGERLRGAGRNFFIQLTKRW